MLMYYCENKKSNDILFDDDLTNIIVDVKDNLVESKMFVLGSFEPDSDKSKTRYHLICNTKKEEFSTEIQTLKKVSDFRRILFISEIDDVYTKGELENIKKDNHKFKFVGVVVEDIDPTRPYVLFVKDISIDNLLSMINRITDLLEKGANTIELLKLLNKDFDYQFAIIYNNKLIHDKRAEIKSYDNYLISKLTF